MVTTHPPEMAEGPAQSEAHFRLGFIDEELQGRPQVAVLGLQTIQPDPLRRAPQLGLGTLRDRQIMPGMAPSYARPLTTLFQPFERILADRLEHAEPRLAVGVFASSNQALGGERFQAIQNVDAETARITDGLGGPHRPPAHEDREATEQAAFALVQEVVTPGDGVAERLLAGRQVARATCQQRQP